MLKVAIVVRGMVRPAEAQAMSRLLQLLLLLELLENALSTSSLVAIGKYLMSLAAQRVLTVHSMCPRGVGSNISVLDIIYREE